VQHQQLMLKISLCCSRHVHNTSAVIPTGFQVHALRKVWPVVHVTLSLLRGPARHWPPLA
jgi:hypothetical protein